jgi:hypothetical protein
MTINKRIFHILLSLRKVGEAAPCQVPPYRLLYEFHTQKSINHSIHKNSYGAISKRREKKKKKKTLQRIWRALTMFACPPLDGTNSSA